MPNQASRPARRGHGRTNDAALRSRGEPPPLERWVCRRRSLFRETCPAQAFENGCKLLRMRRVVAHRSPVDPSARNGEGRVEREAGLDGGIGLVKSAKPRESDGQMEMSLGIISIGLDRPPTP